MSQGVAHRSEGQPAKHFYIPSLDGIRAVAFLIVFASHVPNGSFFPGGLGVTIFFFLSGYLITTLLRMEQEHQGQISFREFYLRRALRIFPPMYLALVLSIVISVVLGHRINGWIVLTQAAHATNYTLIYHGEDGLPLGSKILWSLAIEEHFYLVFPLFFHWLTSYVPKRSSQAAWLLVLCGLVCLWRVVLVLIVHVPAIRVSHATDTRIDSILFGCSLALWMNPMLDQLRFSMKHLVAASIIASFVLVGTVIPRSVEFRETIRYTIQGIALAPLFITAIVLHDRVPVRWLSMPVVRGLGLISYMLYLSHLIIIESLSRAGIKNGIVVTMSAFIGSVTISIATYFFIEKPAARIRRRLSRIVSARSTTAS